MKFIFVSTFFVAIGLHHSYVQSQQTPNAFEGTWKGTSLCQVKNSPCHDETVVYYISKTNKTDSFSIKANKIVNGVEEEMGILPFLYDAKKNELNSSAYGKWNFKLENGKIKGTLISQGQLYRIIEVSKQK